MKREYYDIVFVGNLSIDKKICLNKKQIEVIGGSALNSYCVCDKNLKKAIYSNGFKNNNLNRIVNLNTKQFIPNIFEINEINETCKSYINSEVELCDEFSCNQLHISFRKGVNVDSFLNGKIKYNSLSIDVMFFSIQNYIEIIKKYANKIDFIFCNAREYELIKNIDIKGLFIVTNANKPIMVVNSNQVKYYYFYSYSKIKSTTGAGDSFIGGFLGNFIKTKNIFLAIKQGIACSQLCLLKYGNLELINKKILPYKKIFELPTKIFVIGPSCAGKSTLINNIIKILPFYKIYDDLAVLKEKVEIDAGLLKKRR